MSHKYRVNSGCSVLVREGPINRVVREGTHLPADYATPEVIKEHIANRFVLPVGSREEEKRSEDAPFAPGVSDILPVSGKEEELGGGIKIAKTPDGKNEIKVSLPSGNRKGSKTKQDKSPWVFDPDSLKDEPLDSLNIRILENSKEDEPPQFESEEEAIAYLSQDFKA